MDLSVLHIAGTKDKNNSKIPSERVAKPSGTMKVLHLRSSFGVFGVENVIIQLATELFGTKYRPIIGVFENSQNVHTELADVAKRNDLQSIVFQCRQRFDFRTIWSIRRFVLKNNIQIVHSHGYKADLFALLAIAFKNVRLVATCYPWLAGSRSLKQYARLDKICLSRYDRIVAESEEIKNEAIKSGVAASKISVIENGINVGSYNGCLEKDKIYKEFGIGEDTKVIGTVARLSEEKGHDVLLRAAKMLVKDFQNIFFIIVGDGPLKEKLKYQAAEMGLAHQVHFTGIYPDIARVLAVIDIFVLPSLIEGLPMALLEAMAAKKPVVATRVGTIPRIVEDNKSGMLVLPGDIYQLKEAISYLLCHQKKATQLAENARLKIVRDYSSKQMGKKYIKLYDDLLTKEVRNS